MAEHPVIGERILQRTPQLGHLAPIVRQEHERWDGGGYPDGLAGSAIPVASRIILACDAYNAMITTRPYREAMSAGDAIAELRAKSGSQFDPQVVEALLESLGADHLGGLGDVISVAV
jgi:HD-GYP domain-containing protein (c-di-GMP phosphodiesterase class II)